MTREEQGPAFERFANAFLLEEYPELHAIGGKHDRGIDARVVDGKSGKPTLIVQSCVSPATVARTKILGTIKKLDTGMLPSVLVYCTSAKIGIALDKTKQELRKDYGVILEVYDGPWFCQRELSSELRAKLAAAYSAEVLAPLLKTIQPNQLYSGVLSETEERVAIQYLEAHNLERSQNRNWQNRFLNPSSRTSPGIRGGQTSCLPNPKSLMLSESYSRPSTLRGLKSWCRGASIT